MFAVSAADVLIDVVDDDGGARGRQRDRVRASEPPPATGHDRDLAVNSDLAHRRNLNRHSAATAGRSEPLTSIVAAILA